MVGKMNHDITVTYNNVRLRPLAHNDIELLRIWRNDSSISHFLKQIPHITPEMQESWFIEYLGDEDLYTWAIDEIGELNRYVGSVSLYNFSEDVHKPIDLTYNLAASKRDLTVHCDFLDDVKIETAGSDKKSFSCEFGKLMIGDLQARGRKLGFTSTALCTHIAFEIFGVELIYMSADRENIPACKVYDKVGFT
jgi:RimJ/RimL family protein N-acetyltransferase